MVISEGREKDGGECNDADDWVREVKWRCLLERGVCCYFSDMREGTRLESYGSYRPFLTV